MLVHVDAVKEFYVKMTVIHLKKKDVVKSSVKGIGIEFDHERSSYYTWCARKNLESVNTSKRENGIWWIGSGENRRRDDDVDVPEEEAEEEDEGNKDDFDWEAVIDEATVEGESGSGEKFYDAEDKDQGSPEVQEEIPAAAQQKEKGTAGVDPSGPTAEFRKSNR
ncbi:hypothetical protein Dimus_003444 [Dionaea muscipula]